MRAGDSATNLNDVDDEFVSVYTLEGDIWTVASNLDKSREQKPSLDVYRRVVVRPSSLVIDDIEMTDTPLSFSRCICNSNSRVEMARG